MKTIPRDSHHQRPSSTLALPWPMRVAPFLRDTMANKFKWFTHDNDATEDEWVQEMIRTMGFAAYGRWWTLIENFDRHGKGGSWVTSGAFLREKLRCRSRELELLLNFYQTSGKVLAVKDGEKLTISIPKLRERQSKMKSKARSILPQSSAKTPIEGEGEGEGEGEERTTTAPAARQGGFTPIQRVVNAYKEAKGVGMEDKGWDRANFSRYTKAAKSLIECLGGWEPAAVYVIGKGREFDDKDLDWTLETIKKHAWDNRGKLNAGAHPKMDTDPVLGPRGVKRTSRPRKQIVHAGKIVARGALDGLRPDGGKIQD